MNRPNHLRQAKSLTSKLGVRKNSATYSYEIDVKEVPRTQPQKPSINLFDKINKMFDDPQIKNIRDVDHDDFLAKDIKEDRFDFPEISSKNRLNGSASGLDILSKAKSLLERKQSEIPAAKEKQFRMQKAIQQKQQKENTFVTGLGLYSDPPQEDPPKHISEIIENDKQKGEDGLDDDDDDDEDYSEFDENEYLKNLHIDEFDDLAELRKMIASTKKELEGYAGEVYSLKNEISDINTGFNDTGFGVDDELFSEIGRELNRFMPGGDTKKLFDDIEKKNRDSQPILSTAQKKAIKKNTFVGGSAAIPPLVSMTNNMRSSVSQSGIRRPPIVRQPVLDKMIGSVSSNYNIESISGNTASRFNDLAPISGSTKQMRTTFY